MIFLGIIVVVDMANKGSCGLRLHDFTLMNSQKYQKNCLFQMERVFFFSSQKG